MNGLARLANQPTNSNLGQKIISNFIFSQMNYKCDCVCDMLKHLLMIL